MNQARVNSLDNNKLNLFIAKAMMIFIAIQPILDLVTSYSRIILGSSFTPGIIIRFLVMTLGALYITFRSRREHTKKYFWYLSILAIFFTLNLVVSYFYKPQFHLMRELTAVAKLVYIIEMLFVYIIAFKDLKNANLLKKYFPMNIMISQLIINITMIVSAVTNTGIESYDGVLKSGNSGWFYAANELGTLVGICFPILLWMALKEEDIKTKILSWFTLITSTYTLLAIGTKVGYLAIVLTLIAAVITLLFEVILNYRKSEKNNYKNIIFIVLYSMVFILGTPYYPVAQNTNSHVELINSKEPELKPGVDNSTNENNNVITQVIYSSRDVFQKDFVTQYKEAKLPQKIFGLGFSGNYIETPKIIERDFHDIFYQYGILGFILAFLPFLYYGFKILFKAITDLLNIFTIKYIMLFSSIAIGFGVAFIAGHSLMAPAVSSYIALLFGYLVVDLNVE